MDSDFLLPAETDKFKKVIGAYTPSSATVNSFSNSKFAVIAGPAVSGKDTLREGLLADYPGFYQKILSLTTRPPRGQETGTYKFIALKKMMDLAEQKKLLQIALVHNQQVSAIGSTEIENIPHGKIGLGILIVQAEQSLYKLKPDMKTIFMIPPSYDDFIQRIKQDRISSDDEIRRRLVSAQKEINIALKTDRYYLLVSDIQENVRQKAHDFLQEGKRNKQEEERAKKTCLGILRELNSQN